MTVFAKSQHCRLRVHCPACRTDAAWRRSVGAPDVCPHGVTLADLPPAVDLAAVATERLAVCDECDDESCGVKHQSSCRARALLARENFHCPQGRF